MAVKLDLDTLDHLLGVGDDAAFKGIPSLKPAQDAASSFVTGVSSPEHHAATAPKPIAPPAASTPPKFFTGPQPIGSSAAPTSMPTLNPAVNSTAHPAAQPAPTSMPAIAPMGGSPEVAPMMTPMGAQGPSKPPESAWQKIAHGLGVAADIAAPRIAPRIPGTPMYEQAQEQRQATLGEEKAKTGLEEQQAETEREKPEQQELQGEMRGRLAEQAQNASEKRQDERLGAEEKGRQESEAASEKRLTQTETAAEKRQGETQAEADKRQQQSEANAERRQGAQFGEQEKLEKMRQGNSGNTAFDRVIAENAAKDIGTANGADFRFRSMNDSYPRALKGDQQAQLNLLANHIGMTLGLQKGARITQAILDEAQKSTPWLQRIGAKFDKDGYLSGVALSAQQMGQMMTLARDQRKNAWDQAGSSAEQAGLKDRVDKMRPQDLEEGGGHSFTLNGKKYSGVPDDIYKKYKGQPGFKE